MNDRFTVASECSLTMIQSSHPPQISLFKPLIDTFGWFCILAELSTCGTTLLIKRRRLLAQPACKSRTVVRPPECPSYVSNNYWGHLAACAFSFPLANPVWNLFFVWPPPKLRISCYVGYSQNQSLRTARSSRVFLGQPSICPIEGCKLLMLRGRIDYSTYLLSKTQARFIDPPIWDIFTFCQSPRLK